VNTRAISTVVVLALLGAACGAGNSETVAGADDMRHIHDLVLDSDGQLLVASHTGLYRIDAVDRAVLIGTEQHDLMAMTSNIDGALLAGGHPDLRLDSYRVEGSPPFLGLVRSGDNGESWDVVGLLGDVDFHALVSLNGTTFGAAGSSVWRLDTDGAWVELGQLGARDLAIDPGDAERQLAPDYDGGVWFSTDGAVTWTELDNVPSLVEIEWIASDTIIGIDAGGTVWTATEPEGAWTEFADGPVGVETLFVDPSGSWWVTVSGGEISRSDDKGRSWARQYLPPDAS